MILLKEEAGRGDIVAWFFTDDAVSLNKITLTGEQAQHIIKSLRMKPGEEITVCDKNRVQHNGVISGIDNRSVEIDIIKSFPCENEPSVAVTLFPALTKGDKMDLVIQKAVELGAHNIVPVITERCISRPDKNAQIKKQQRWQKIATGAAQQSRRGIIPQVANVLTLKQAAEALDSYDKTIVFYEGGGKSTGELIEKKDKNIAVFIGSEGGFAPQEIELLEKAGARCATLGRRILRAETAPIAAMSILMYITGNF